MMAWLACALREEVALRMTLLLHGGPFLACRAFGVVWRGVVEVQARPAASELGRYGGGCVAFWVLGFIARQLGFLLFWWGS